uniref:Putative tick ixostatin n=1 Tax=Ixodes ricinus TaxID=34613 RepID=V5HA82_IXORI
MQLVLFIVIVTFTPLSCEVQSESIPAIFGNIDYMSETCKDKLRDDLVEKCGESLYQTQFVVVSGCTYKCGEEHNNGLTKATTGQEFRLNDWTPCGHDMVCRDGQCIDRCLLPFVNLKGDKVSL